MESREFDLETKSFVKGGFSTPEAKQSADWVSPDTLLIGTDWGEDSLTESGYPRILKRWQRGTALSEAEEVISGDVTDVAMWPFTVELDDGRILQGGLEADTFHIHPLDASGGRTEPSKFPFRQIIAQWCLQRELSR